MMRRLWQKIDRSSEGCWVWTAAMRPNGYGMFTTGTHRDQTLHLAHRYVYELLVGPIPEGLVLDHLCRNRRCVNPAHLEPVTQRENVLRCPTSPPTINAAKTECIHGHAFDADNTRFTPRGTRKCRACARRHAAEARARKAAR